MKRLPITIVDLKSGHCRWVHGDPSHLDTHRYCGKEAVPTTSWCIAHLKRVTPTAQTIIRRELTKWKDEMNGVVRPIRVAAKMTEAETRDKREHIPDIVEEMEKRL